MDLDCVESHLGIRGILTGPDKSVRFRNTDDERWKQPGESNKESIE